MPAISRSLRADTPSRRRQRRTPLVAGRARRKPGRRIGFHARVAQWNRAPVFETGRRRFESCLARQFAAVAASSSFPCASSSADESSRLLSGRSQVQILPCAPPPSPRGHRHFGSIVQHAGQPAFTRSISVRIRVGPPLSLDAEADKRAATGWKPAGTSPVGSLRRKPAGIRLSWTRGVYQRAYPALTRRGQGATPCASTTLENQPDQRAGAASKTAGTPQTGLRGRTAILRHFPHGEPTGRARRDRFENGTDPPGSAGQDRGSPPLFKCRRGG